MSEETCSENNLKYKAGLGSAMGIW